MRDALQNFFLQKGLLGDLHDEEVAFTSTDPDACPGVPENPLPGDAPVLATTIVHHTYRT